MTFVARAWGLSRLVRAGQNRTIDAALFSTSSTGQREAANAPLSLVTQGNAPPKSSGPFGDKDVSILKLDGYSQLPTLPVGNDTTVEAGQRLYVDGFPAAAESGNTTNASTPTVTDGSIASKKVSDLGVSLIETSATVSGGNSGGPGLDDSGSMVGVVSYGTTTGSYNYLIGSSVVQQVKALYAGHPYVDTFIQQTQVALQEGKDQTPLIDGTALELVVAGGILLGLIVAVLPILLVAV